ncbi:hypothetical protein C477_21735 [Haloterrigena salina JCM 13891]|uniref:Uncharacterized protein n=1 Tax=Haloterrigena salina JCM 13891 TaxID=1227488 RepID=M0BQD6_9EURY|nr:hypothetical protein [Haloterrigena salina]ELZ13125.1 hypothetical protein C477_21735 [Haloterrigena salina JCM 13891]
MGHVVLLEILVGRRLGQLRLEVLEFLLDLVQFAQFADEQVALGFDHAVSDGTDETQRNLPVR